MKQSQCESYDQGSSSVGDATDQNSQVARLIVARGENDAGKMAILKAVAEHHGVIEDKMTERLASGRALPEELLRVPSHLRAVLCEIGLHCAIALVNVIETVETKAILMASEEWNDLELEVALDSGAVIHVCSPGHCPGYALEGSPGSKPCSWAMAAR